jgi:uncharacterized SAM-dependent methyltransferase
LKYFKNTELAKLYNISEKSVRNWIEAAQEGKLELQLYEEKGRTYVANVSRNTQIIEELAQKGKKYRNSRGFKTICPSERFYEVFNSKQLFDIISCLSVHRELPLKYSYVDAGASYWDKYAERLLEEEAPSTLTNTIDLLQLNLDTLDLLIDGHKRVNIIDLGPGNGLPIKQLLAHLLKRDKLNRYVALDISKDMLNIAERHIKEWFGGEVAFEGYIRDLEYERFDDLFAKDYVGDEANVPLNIVLFLGDTLGNLRSPNLALQAINNSLGLNDLLVYCTKLDTPNSRRYFDFHIVPENQKLTPRHKLILDLLNIDESLYDVEQKFDEKREARLISIRLKVALSINFTFANSARRVELNKGDSILLWRYWHRDAIDVIKQFDQNAFNLLHATKSKNQEYILLVSKIKNAL